MRIGVWITIAALALAGCTQDDTAPTSTNQNNPETNQNKPVTTAKPTVGGGNTPATSAAPASGNTSGTANNQPVRPDNSAVNERDSDDKTILPTDQGNSQADTDMTAEIRREVLKIEDLSVNGRNVKIITNGGKVALRGPVISDAERKAIEDVAHRVAGKENVRSALEVAP
jgi:hypothetical protein